MSHNERPTKRSQHRGQRGDWCPICGVWLPDDHREAAAHECSPKVLRRIEARERRASKGNGAAILRAEHDLNLSESLEWLDNHR